MAAGIELPTLIQRYRLDPTGFATGSSQVRSENEKTSGSFGKVAKAVAGLGAAAVAAKFLKDSLSAATDEQKNVAVLAATLKNIGVGKAGVDSTEKFLDKIEQTTGHLKDETIPAFQRLITAHVPLAKAQQLFSQSLDISTARGVPLVAVTTALGKAYDGNLGSLKRLGIAVPAASESAKQLAAQGKAVGVAYTAWNAATQRLTDLQTIDHAKKKLSVSDLIALRNAQDKVTVSGTKYHTLQKGFAVAYAASSHATSQFDTALKGAAKTMGGSAAAASKTAAGQVAIMHARIHEVEVRVGNFLIPILTKLAGFVTGTLIPDISSLTDWFQRHHDVLIAVGVALGILAAGFVAMKIINTVNGMVKEAQAAWAALNVVMDANPWILVAAAIAAVVAGLVYAYTHVKWFHDFVNAAMSDIKIAFFAVRDAGVALWQGIQSAWQNFGYPLFSILRTAAQIYFLPLIVAFDLVRDHWAGIMSGMKAVWDTVGAPVFRAVQSLAGAMGSAIAGTAHVVSSIIGVLGGAWNAFANLWNSTIGKIHVHFHVWGTGITIDFKAPTMPTFGGGGGGPGATTFTTTGAAGAGVHFARGGIVPGARGYAAGGVVDSVPAMLTPGEGVLTVATMRSITRDLFGAHAPASSSTTIGQQHTGNTYIVQLDGVQFGKVQTAEDLVRLLHQLDMLEGVG